MASSNRSPSPRRWIVRIAQGLAGFGILVAIVAAAAPWAFSNTALRTEIAAQILRLTGLAVTAQGHAVFVVLPRPHISVDDVSFASAPGTLRVDARYLKGYVRLASLLRGKIEIVSLTLGEPEIDANLDALEFAGPPSGADSGSSASTLPLLPPTRAPEAARLAAVTITDGRAHIKSALLASDLAIGAVNMTFDWPQPDGSATMAGQASLQGESAELAAWIASPLALLRGQRSLLSLKIDAPSCSLTADGSVEALPKPQFSGHLRATAHSLRALLDRAGYHIPLPGPFNGFDASGEADLERASAVLSGLRLRFDGNAFEGTLAWRAREGIPMLSGTLAASQLSLRPLEASLLPAAGRDGQWNREPFDLHALGTTDFDLRLSAGHLIFSRFEIEDAAVSLLRNGSSIEIALAGARAYQGTARGRLTLGLADNGVGVRAAAVVSGADLAALSFDAFGWPEFYGSLTGTFDAESHGASLRDLMRGLEGLAHIDITQGQIGGLDLDLALRRLDKSPLGLLNGLRRGRTAFDRASFGLRLAKGVGTLEDGRLESPALKLAFGGSIDFGERALDLHAIATPAPAQDKPQREAADFRFDIAGSWDDLTFTPDVRSLIRRSGAAAPLLPQPPTRPAPAEQGAK